MLDTLLWIERRGSDINSIPSLAISRSIVGYLCPPLVHWKNTLATQTKTFAGVKPIFQSNIILLTQKMFRYLCAPRAPYFHFVDRWSIFLEIIKKAAMAFYQLGSIMHMQFVLQMKARFRF